MNRGVEEAWLFRDGCGPSFGPRYDFRQSLPPGDYAAFYAERPGEIEEGERPGLTGARPPEHRLVDAGHPPSPLMVTAAVDRHGRADEEFPPVASGVAFVHEDAGRAKKEVVEPDTAYGRTLNTEREADRKRPRPGPLREGDLPWERYLGLFAAEVAPRVRDAARPKPA